MILSSPRMCAQLGVQVRDRLVEQEQPGLADNGAADRRALLLPPDNSTGLRSRRPSISSSSAALATLRLMVSPSSPRSRSGLAMFSNTVLCG